MSSPTAAQVVETAPPQERPRQPPPPSRVSSRLWLGYLLLTSALAVSSAFLPIERGRWLVPVGGLIALSALLRAAGGRRDADRRWAGSPFVLLSAGVVLTLGSELLGAVGGSAASLVHPVALSAYPFLIAGLVALNGTRVHEHAIDTLLVAAIGPSALFAFGWLPLVEVVERWAGTSADSDWASWLVLAVDALAVAIVSRLAVLFRGRPVAYQMLLGAMACMLGAHIARAIGAAIGLAPAPFGGQALLLLSFALTAGACLHPSMKPSSAMKTRADSIGRGHVLLLVAVVLVGPVFALVRYGDRGSWVLLVAGGPAAVSLLVVAHLARLIRERQRLEYLSTHDALTGLPNRTAFHDRLALLLTRAGAGEGPAVVFLDLDRFKHVNDTFGHDVGDDLLRQVASRLRQGVRADDTVARLAGDEFALLLAAPCGASRADDVVRRILASFAEPFMLPGVALSVSPSMGVALAPEHGDDVEVLLRNADSAMYAAKAGGRNGARTFQPGMASATERHLLLERRFRRALADGELVVHYQPRVDPVSRQLLGVEALVRWDHPQIGLVPPGAFISMAESTGLVADLGRQVLEQACADAATWRRAGASLAVSVNVSPRQFALQDVPAVVTAAIGRSGLPADALELEITESLHLGDDGSVTDALDRLSSLGVTCAVDDFGTGYSSIAVLRDYPIGVVKLDRSFVQPAGGAADAPLVRGVVQLAQGLGMRVVAEGVETEAQMDFLAGILCDEIQGFLISRAVPADHIAAVIRDGGGRPEDVSTLAPVLLDVDERGLVELLWAEQEEDERSRAAQPEMRLAAILGTAATVMAVPIVLGIGAGGGLPPTLQAGLNTSLVSVGLEGPEDAPASGTVLALPAGGPAEAADRSADGPTARPQVPQQRSGADAASTPLRQDPSSTTAPGSSPPVTAPPVPVPVPVPVPAGAGDAAPPSPATEAPRPAPAVTAEDEGAPLGPSRQAPPAHAPAPSSTTPAPVRSPGRVRPGGPGVTGRPSTSPGGKPTAAPGKGRPTAPPGQAARPAPAPGDGTAGEGRPTGSPGDRTPGAGRPTAPPGQGTPGAGRPTAPPGRDGGGAPKATPAPTTEVAPSPTTSPSPTTTPESGGEPTPSPEPSPTAAPPEEVTTTG